MHFITPAFLGVEAGKGNGNIVKSFQKHLLFVSLLFLCTITHAAFLGTGSGCFLAVELNTNEEKWETGLGYHGKYEEP